MSMQVSGLKARAAGRRLILSLAVVAGVSSAASADTVTWSGAVSGNWSDPGNWAGGVLPQNGDDLVFPAGVGTRTLIHDLAALTSVNSINITSGLYALSGNALTIVTSETSSAGGTGVAFAHNNVTNITGAFTVNVNSAPRIDFNNEISGAGSFTKAGNNTSRWTGAAKTFSGGLFINAGTLDLTTNDNQIPYGAGKGDVTIASGAFLFNNNTNFQMNGLNGAGSITRGGTNTKTITIGNNNANGTFTGSITTAGGSSGIVKTGTGTQSLAALTLVGQLSANAGELNLNGAMTGTSIVVAAGATLGGTGSSSQSAGITVNGTYAPGGSAGTGTFDASVATSIAFNAGSTFAVQIGGATPGDGAGFYDQLNSTNAAASVVIDPTASLVASLSGTPALTAANIAYILTRADAGSTAAFAGLAEGATVSLGGGNTAQITYAANWTGSQATSTLTGGNDVALYNFALAPIPEPASLAALGLAGVALLGRRRKA